MQNDIPLGLVPTMPNAEYHALNALGSSGIKRLARSPAHYFASIDPAAPKQEATAAMKAGTLAHCALLEPGELYRRYVVRPDGLDLRTKEGKAWAASMPADLELISHQQMDTALMQADSVRSLPDVAALLSRGSAEVSAFWLDEATGVHCKCRPDWVSPAGDGVVLVDLKTCQDASPEGFPKTIARFGYHLQAAWYSKGYEQASGKRVLGFVFACVESDYPHAAAAYMLDDESIDKGHAECQRLLNLFAECRSANRWPAYSTEIQPLTLPAWA
jgi:hypothetical protein